MNKPILKHEEEWLKHELSFYKGTCVEAQDIRIGYCRIAYIFHCAPHMIHAGYQFGKDLDASFKPSWHKPNELDKILFDIEDFELILPSSFEMNKERVTTVKDYITIFAQCRMLGEKGYKDLIEDWVDEQHATRFGKFLKAWFGVLPKRFVKKG